MTQNLGSRPSRLPDADLAAAFGPPNRTGALGGKLAPRPAQQSVQASRADDESSRPAPLRAVPPEAANDAPGTELGQSAVQTVVVYLPASLRDRVRSYAGTHKLTYTDLALAAIEDTYPRLADLLSHTSPRVRVGGLFKGPARPRRQRHDEPQVQVSLRPTKNDLTTLDRLVAETNAPSRSALVTVALTAYLDQ